MHSIYSTIATDVRIVDWITTPGNDLPTEGRSVVIKGGAGVQNLVHTLTPIAVRTDNVSDEDMTMLLGNPVFVKFVENGYVRHIENRSLDPEKVVQMMGMNPDDKSRQSVAMDFQKGGRHAKDGEVTVRSQST